MNERDDNDKSSIPQPKSDSTTFNSKHAQCIRLMDYMGEHGSVTTVDARRDLDIMMPAARIFELRAMGHRIDTVWVEQETECGRIHRVARYVLIEEADHA